MRRLAAFRRGRAGVVIPAALLLMLAAEATAHKLPPSVEAVPGLHHEPIQPLSPPEGLDPDKVRLGERLFLDPRLSRDNDMACGSCHDLGSNGADNLPHPKGRTGAGPALNTLTVFNGGLNHRQFWDGRANSLEEQIDFVVTNPGEFATSWPEIVARLRQDPDYGRAFGRLYPDGITAAAIRDAIATFERSLVTLDSPFDRFLLGDAEAISAEAKEGYRLFKDYGCASCHQGSNVGGNLFMKFGVFGDYFADRGDATQAYQGRFNVTGKDPDRYVFRVPSLRLAVLTAPYLHDGSVKTLEQVIRVMAKYQLGYAIPDRDIHCLVAFLQTLPGKYRGRRLGATGGDAERAAP
ncbi:MAG TPA: cytochrome B6 [Sedimenticola sp.]|nr:cytochrome B6 [Sedimenticola sp.]